MIERKAFKYRLKPNKTQTAKFVQFAGACRFVFNRGLANRKQTYEDTKKSPTYYEQNKELTQLKKQEDTAWLKEIHSQILQQSLKDLDQAYKHFFRRIQAKEKPGYPKFKCKGVHDAFRYPQSVIIEGDKVYLPKIGWVAFRKSREIQGTIKQATITREGDHWNISLTCENEKPEPTPAPINEDKAIGIDVGLSAFATCAIGKQNTCQIIAPPKYLHKHLHRLKILQRRLSKKQKGSRNRYKLRKKITKLHCRIKNLRKNFAHQLSAQMIKTHDIICVESLNITAMLQNKTYKLSRAITDASWRQFLNYLKYKAIALGKHFVEAGKYFPSTKKCSSCGNLQEMSLSMREFNCSRCNLKLNRDYNSSISIKAAGMSVLKACGVANCGHGEARISFL